MWTLRVTTSSRSYNQQKYIKSADAMLAKKTFHRLIGQRDHYFQRLIKPPSWTTISVCLPVALAPRRAPRPAVQASSTAVEGIIAAGRSSTTVVSTPWLQYCTLQTLWYGASYRHYSQIVFTALPVIFCVCWRTVLIDHRCSQKLALLRL